MEKRCYGCMKLKEKSPVCEHCGYNENVPNYSHQLPTGTVLKGQYLVGKVLGQGGFGITYMGWDQSLQTAVAIKEYYPNSYVNRDCNVSRNVVCAGEGVEGLLRQNRERFLREARILAKLQNVPGIVRVQNLFAENNTAYIVMEYVEGIDLKRYIRSLGRVLTVGEAFHVLRPIMDALQKVHAAELVHRDISPDNIMILPDGTAKLLDFGAAREVENAEVDKELPQSTEAILKHGFAPIEQYRRRGSLGPWTDVYALCATMYYCLTGKVPNSAPERIMGDDNVNWRQIPGLTEQQIATLEKGMTIMPKDRTRSMGELHRGLFGEGKQTTASQAPAPRAKPADYPTNTVPLEETSGVMETKKKKKPVAAIAAAVLAIIAAVGLFALKPKAEEDAVSLPEILPAATETVEGTEPVVLTQEQLQYLEAEALEKAGEYGKAAIAFGKLGNYEDARERSFALWESVPYRQTVCVWENENKEAIIHALGEDGLVRVDAHICEYCGDGLTDAETAQHHTGMYQDIVSIWPTEHGVIGLRSDGTLALPSTNYPCYQELSQWTDIIHFSASGYSTWDDDEKGTYFGVKTDGTVVSAGANGSGVRDVDSWTNIVCVSSSGDHTLGLRSDGTVVAVGSNRDGQCDVDSWTDIITILADGSQSYGLRSDGSMVALGYNAHGIRSKVSQRRNVAILERSQPSYPPLAIQKDGSFLGTSYIEEKIPDAAAVITVVPAYSVSSGHDHFVVLKNDGTLWGNSISEGSRAATWTDIMVPRTAMASVQEPTEISTANEEAYTEAEALEKAGEYGKAAIAFGKLGDYEDARERSFALWDKVALRDTVSANKNHTVALANDGTVVATGRNTNNKGVVISGGLGPCDVGNWTDIIAVSAGLYHTVGLKADGTVVAIGDNHDDQLDVSGWTDIVAISAGNDYTLGLRSDGTVVSTRESTEITNWTDIVSLSALRSSAGLFRVAGVSSDGTVVCNYNSDVASWTDIVSVAVGPGHIIGLKKDGTVVAAGSNRSGQCDVAEWTDIVAIDASGGQTSTAAGRTVGLKKDGTVVAAGFNADVSWHDVAYWTAVAAVSTSGDHTVAVRHDGSVVAVGNRSYGRCDVDDWAYIKLPTKPLPARNGGEAAPDSPSGEEVITKNRLMSDRGPSAITGNEWEFFQTYTVLGSDIKRNKIMSVTFVKTLKDAPEDAWDVSENLDGSVLAWVEKSADNYNYYDLFIGADGTITAPENCSYLFAGYSNARSIAFNGVLDTSAVTNMSNMFYVCTRLTELDVGSFDTSSVTDMSNMFCTCEQLWMLKLRNFDTSRVTDMSGMFSACQNLNQIDVSSFDTSNVTDMSNMFFRLSTLQNLDLQHFDTSKVTDMSWMFSECGKLWNLKVGNWETDSVVNYEFFFFPDRKIEDQRWQEWFENREKTYFLMSDRCPSTLGEPEYQNCSVFGSGIPRKKIMHITFQKTLKNAPADAWDVSENQDGTVLAWTETNAENSGYYDLFIGANGTIAAPEDCGYLFAGYSNAESISFGGVLDTGSVTTMEYMFLVCTRLSELDVSAFDTSGVTSMCCMFAGCSGLTELDCSSFDTARVTDMSCMFSDCNNLRSLNVKGFDTSNVIYMGGMFQQLYSLTALDISSFDTSKVQYMEYMFSESIKLADLNLGNWETDSIKAYDSFLYPGKKINGRPWEELFQK